MTGYYNAYWPPRSRCSNAGDAPSPQAPWLVAVARGEVGKRVAPVQLRWVRVGAQIALLVTPQISPNCWWDLGTLPIYPLTNFMHWASSVHINMEPSSCCPKISAMISLNAAWGRVAPKVTLWVCHTSHPHIPQSGPLCFPLFLLTLSDCAGKHFPPPVAQAQGCLFSTVGLAWSRAFADGHLL